MHHIPSYSMAHPKLADYQKAAGEIKDMVVAARAGKYKEGYLTILIAALEMLKGHANGIPMVHKDVPMIDKLIYEFQDQLSGPVESPLADLFEEAHEEGNPKSMHK